MPQNVTYISHSSPIYFDNFLSGEDCRRAGQTLFRTNQFVRRVSMPISLLTLVFPYNHSDF